MRCPRCGADAAAPGSGPATGAGAACAACGYPFAAPDATIAPPAPGDAAETIAPGPSSVRAPASETPLGGPSAHGETLVPEAQAGNLVGMTIGGCRVLEKIGRGGMGVVYRARQLGLDRDVALKVITIPGDPEAAPQILARFEREAKLLARVSTARVVQIHGMGVERGVHFIILEYMPGGDLRNALSAQGRFEPEQVLAYARQASEGLLEAEKVGVVHRDLKPSNFMLDGKGEVKIADFGIAKALDMGPGDPLLTADGRVVGTPMYMSPEQARGNPVDSRSDVYSLGATIYHLLTGQTPCPETDSLFEILRKKTSQEHLSPRAVIADARIPDPICALIERMTALDPKARHASFSQVVSDIDAVLAGGAPRRPERPVGESGIRRVHRRSRSAVAAAVAVVALGALAFAFRDSIFGSRARPAKRTDDAPVVTPTPPAPAPGPLPVRPREVPPLREAAAHLRAAVAEGRDSLADDARDFVDALGAWEAGLERGLGRAIDGLPEELVADIGEIRKTFDVAQGSGVEPRKISRATSRAAEILLNADPALALDGDLRRVVEDATRPSQPETCASLRTSLAAIKSGLQAAESRALPNEPWRAWGRDRRARARSLACAALVDGRILPSIRGSVDAAGDGLAPLAEAAEGVRIGLEAIDGVPAAERAERRATLQSLQEGVLDRWEAREADLEKRLATDSDLAASLAQATAFADAVGKAYGDESLFESSTEYLKRVRALGSNATARRDGVQALVDLRAVVPDAAGPGWTGAAVETADRAVAKWLDGAKALWGRSAWRALSGLNAMHLEELRAQTGRVLPAVFAAARAALDGTPGDPTPQAKRWVEIARAAWEGSEPWADPVEHESGRTAVQLLEREIAPRAIAATSTDPEAPLVRLREDLDRFRAIVLATPCEQIEAEGPSLEKGKTDFDARLRELRLAYPGRDLVALQTEVQGLADALAGKRAAAESLAAAVRAFASRRAGEARDGAAGVVTRDATSRLAAILREAADAGRRGVEAARDGDWERARSSFNRAKGGLEGALGDPAAERWPEPVRRGLGEAVESLGRARTEVEDLDKRTGDLVRIARGDAPEAPATFFMEPFEVTEAEFAAFVNDKGYGNASFWPGAPPNGAAPGPDERSGWERIAKQRISQAASRGRRPVEAVNYFEARAFALSRGRDLPTSDEWKRAAIGDPTGIRRTYPWGNSDPAKGQCNLASREAGDVDAFPGAATTAWGSRIANLAGNVAEWTRTRDGGEAAPMRIAGGGYNSDLDPALLSGERWETLAPERSRRGVGFRCVYRLDDALNDWN